MEEKTLQILTKVKNGELTPQIAQEQLFVLFGVSGRLEAIRTGFCLWYYAQSQPLDAHKIVDWFIYNLR